MRTWYSIELTTYDNDPEQNCARFYITSEDGKLEIMNHISYEEGMKTMAALCEEIPELHEEFSNNNFNPAIHYHRVYGYGR